MTFMFVYPANGGWARRQRTNDGETEVFVAAGQEDREDREDRRTERTGGQGGTAVTYHSTHTIFRFGALAGSGWRVKPEGGNQKNLTIMTALVLHLPPKHPHQQDNNGPFMFSFDMYSYM